MNLVNEQKTEEVEAPVEAELDGLMASVEPEPVVEDSDMPHRAEDAEDERPEWLDEKFGSAKDLQKSYDELQKKFSQGKHKAPDEYETTVLTEAGYSTDDPLVDTYLGWAKKYGVNQEAFDELAGSITGMAGENQAEAEINVAAEREALGPNADAIIRSNVNWADGMLRKGIVSNDERAEIDIWGGTAAGQRLLQKMRAMAGDMSKIPIAAVAEAQMSKEEFSAEINSKMNDPRWDSGDPAYHQMVTKMFEDREKAGGFN